MQFLTGGGTMGARIQAFDWSASPLGTPETWLPSLRVTLSNMLRLQNAHLPAVGSSN